MRSKPTINQSWQVLFDRHKIPEQVQQHGLYHIRADEINTVREARLGAGDRVAAGGEHAQHAIPCEPAQA